MLMVTQIAEDASFIKNFIVNHHMKLSIFNEFNTLKLLNVAPTQFAFTIQKIEYIFTFTNSIYDVLKNTNTDALTLHLVHEMWDSMIKKVKNAIYRYERKDEQDLSSFYNVLHEFLLIKILRSLMRKLN
ncbi:hypothetical protein HN51_070195, partial [Arachis hypogaea]